MIVFNLWWARISKIFLFTFLLGFLPLRYSVKKSVLITAIIYALTIPLDYLQYLILAGSSAAVFLTIIQTVVVQATALLLSRYRNWMALFTGISSAAYVLVGNLMASVVYVATENLLMALAVQVLINLLVLFILFRLLRKSFLHVAEQHSGGWSWLCLIPALLYLIEYSLAVWPQNIHDNPENTLPIVLVLVMMVASYILIFNLISRMRQDLEYQRNMDLMASSVSGLKRQIETTQQNQKELSIIKHDMRHDNNVLLAYLKEGRIEEVEQKLQESNHRLETMVTAQYCRNIAVNSVLQTNAALAGQLEVQLDCDVRLSEDSFEGMKELEFASVVSNLVENAVQAAQKVKEKKDRHVTVKIAPVNDRQLLLAVSNHYEGALKISEQTGLPRSERGEGHGFGLQSVRFFAERTDSLFDCTTDDQIFSVRLLIPVGQIHKM